MSTNWQNQVITVGRPGLKLKVLLVAILMVFGIYGSGCSKSTDKDVLNDTNTLTVTDSAGRHVKVPAKIKRIGCLYAFSGHVVTMLGKGENIVAVVDGLKRDKLMTELVPKIKQALVSVSAGAINIEELIKANPDVVFVKGETASNNGEADKLKKSGIPYLVADYQNIKEQQYAVEMIGKAVGASAQAKKYNTYYQRIIDLVNKKVIEIPMQERVKIYHSVNEATRTDTIGTLPADWLQVAGVINVSVNEDLKFTEGKYFASLEQILLWYPEVIIVNEPGVADYILTNKQWSAISAVKNRKVYQMPIGISRWGHPGSLETPLAILWTAKMLYPERFAEIDLIGETKTFYREFFNYQLTDQEVLQILSGQGMRIAKGENS